MTYLYERWLTPDELDDKRAERPIDRLGYVAGAAMFLAVCYFARGLLL
jgi:hypothetical protein